MGSVDQWLSRVNPPTLIVAVLLVVAVFLVIKIGKALLMAGIFGALAAGVSLGQGNPPAAAGTHAAIAFGVAAITLVLIRMAKGFLTWLLITGIGILALLISDVGHLAR
jgi:hypothetical protein